jgi:hypothetical protein
MDLAAKARRIGRRRQMPGSLPAKNRCPADVDAFFFPKTEKLPSGPLSFF